MMQMQRGIWLGALIGGLVIGLVVGLLLGWMVWPVSWAPAPDDIAAMADAYDVNPANFALAKARLVGLSKDEQTRTFNELIKARNQANRPAEAKRISNLAVALGLPIAAAAGATPGPTTATGGRTPTPATSTSPAPLGGLLIPLALLVLVFILLGAAALVLVLKVLPQMRQSAPAERPARTRASPPGTATPPPAKRAAPTAAVRPGPPPKVEPTTRPGGLGHFVASYALGNDNYDTSFSLETAQQEFLGECGMGISETVGEGKPDKVTAFDLWLFDKGDVRTVTQILMSEYAYNDQTLRSKLAAKGDAVLAQKGKIVTLETNSLEIAAQIVELVYATTPGAPPNSHFQKLTLEIVPTIKQHVPA